MENRDYKHVIQDITQVYIGGKLSYDEILDEEDVPYKLKTIFLHYMMNEVAGDTLLENHIFFMKKKGTAYSTYKKLKAKFVLNVFYEDGHGKGKPGYKIKELELDELLDDDYIMANMDTTFLTEVRISKLRMMSIAV